MAPILVDRRVARKKFEREAAWLLGLKESGQLETWDFKEVAYPYIKLHFLMATGKSFIGVIVDCLDYNYMPPSITYTDLQFKPCLINQIPPKHNEKFVRTIVERHPLTHLPFLCVPGIKEYHTHPEHSNDPWDARRYRNFNIYHAIRMAREELDPEGLTKPL